MTISRRGAIKTLAASVPVFRLKPEATSSKESSPSKKGSRGFRLQAEDPSPALLAAIAEVVLPSEADRIARPAGRSCATTCASGRARPAAIRGSRTPRASSCWGIRRWRTGARARCAAPPASALITTCTRPPTARTLDASKKNRWGDPLPAIRHVLDEATRGRAAATREHIVGVFNQLAKGNNWRVLNVSEGGYLDHPAGGCRMGTDAATSVCDSTGRTHDHENLFVVGAPTLPTGGCTNATLTFVALVLRSANHIAG
jgi:choline dehydrogenase-like flavoprotein